MKVIIFITLALIISIFLIPFILSFKTAKATATELSNDNGFSFKTILVVIGINIMGPWFIGFLFGSDIKHFSKIIFLIFSVILIIIKMRQKPKTNRNHMRETENITEKNINDTVESRVDAVEKKKETAKTMNLFGDS